MDEKLIFRDKYNGNHAMAIASIVFGALLVAIGVLSVISRLDFYSLAYVAYTLPQMVSYICWVVMGIFVIRFGCKPWEADFRKLSTVAIIFALSMFLMLISNIFILIGYGFWFALVRRTLMLLAAAVLAALAAVNINRVEGSIKNALICWVAACVCFWLSEWALGSVFMVALLCLALALPLLCFTDIGARAEAADEDFEMEFEIGDEPFEMPRKKAANTPNPAFDETVSKLKDLKMLFEQDIISAEEYEAKRLQLVEKL